MTNKHIILIAAFAPESGKSTFARELNKAIQVKLNKEPLRASLAEPLKLIVRELLHLSGYTKEESADAVYGNAKADVFKIRGIPQPTTHREILQKLGTEFRHLINCPNLWVDMFNGESAEVFEWAEEQGVLPIVMVEDWRFIEEYEGISKFATENNIKVHTVCIRNAKAEAKYKSDHSSEGGLTNFKFDHIFWNNMDEEFFDQAFEFAKIFEVKTDDSTV